MSADPGPPDVDPVPASPYLDEAFVADVVAMADPVERNRRITRGYHELAIAMATIVGREDANWLCFGQWASAEAGRAIRGVSVPAIVRPLIGHEVAKAVGAGNANVFGDVAPPFIRFILAFREAPLARTDPTGAREILAELQAHSHLSPSDDLRIAFAAYTDALLLRSSAEPSAAKRRAERILVANVSVGAHEQLVAEPHVRAAIPGRWIVAIAATAHLGIRIPDGLLHLNRDIPLPDYLGGAQFPPGLLQLDDPDAIGLAHRFRQDLASTRDSDAPDWESYDERMGYIFSLLRAYQQDPEMFELPPWWAD